MRAPDAQQLQQDLRALGLYEGEIDGLWGPLSQRAYRRAMNRTGRPEHGEMAWGAKVTPAFKQKVCEIADRLAVEPNWLMACMAFESGRTFRPDVTNQAGSGATGLIQFMPRTAKHLGTTTEALAAMSAVEQLEYVYRYLAPFKGRMKNLGDVYLAILWPAAVGKRDDYPLWAESEGLVYRQNRGLDADRDGMILRREAVRRVTDTLIMGMDSTNYG